MTSFEEELKDKLGSKTLLPLDGSNIGGGCISQAKGYKVDNGNIFVKRSKGQHARLMFDGEFESLNSILLTKTVKCPKPIAVMEDPTQDLACAIVMEYMNLSNLNDQKGFKLGQDLANLHKYNEQAIAHEERLAKWIGRRIPIADDTSTGSNKPSEEEIIAKAYNLKIDNQQNESSKFVEDLPLKAQLRFGYDIPTCCGALPQVNDWCDDWVIFFARNRLDHQIQMLIQDYGDRELNENWSILQIRIEKYFQEFKGAGNNIKPSLLHGDLWSGNVGIVTEGDTEDIAIYDPSSFYGHNEYEFGIASMFGGIPQSFYDGYFKVYKRSSSFDKRIELYQLFHQLNHWNHFGKGYRESTLGLLKQLNSMNFR